MPVNITSATGSPDINTTTTAAAPATTVAANPETTVAAVATTATAADYEPSVALAPLSPLYAVLLCPYLQRDLGDKAFVKSEYTQPPPRRRDGLDRASNRSGVTFSFQSTRPC